ncbi:HlyD family type I secretion periplasmic adaptor subunit, partial [Rhizobiaceae sp. 2RAB30]
MSTEPDVVEAKAENLPVPADRRKRNVARNSERMPVIAEFQSDAVELEERVPPRVARLTLYGVTAFIGAAVLWA